MSVYVCFFLHHHYHVMANILSSKVTYLSDLVGLCGDFVCGCCFFFEDVKLCLNFHLAEGIVYANFRRLK